MRNSVIYLGILLSLLYLAGMIYYVQVCSQAHEQAKTLLEERAQLLDFSDRLLNLQEWMTEVAYEKKKIKASELETSAQKHQGIANENSLVVLMLSLLYSVFLLFIFGKKHRIFALFLSTAFVAIVFLIQGIFNPMMQLEAYKTNLTVKAKVTPINTPEYARGKILLDSMDRSLNLKMDSLVYSIDQRIDDVDKRLIDLKDNLIASSEIMKNVPIVGESSSDKLSDISAALPLVKPLIIPYVSDLKAQLLAIKETFMDSLIAKSDRYAEETYGINKVFPDKTYFYFQQKSIVAVIGNLWKEGNYIVALALVLFSILFPFIKILISFLLLLVKKLDRYFPQKFLTGISKWSMADVFVASSFLTYMSFSNLQVGVEIESKIGMGLYFFLAYAILSIVLSVLLKKSIQHRDKISN